MESECNYEPSTEGLTKFLSHKTKFVQAKSKEVMQKYKEINRKIIETLASRKTKEALKCKIIFLTHWLRALCIWPKAALPKAKLLKCSKSIKLVKMFRLNMDFPIGKNYQESLVAIKALTS